MDPQKEAHTKDSVTSARSPHAKERMQNSSRNGRGRGAARTAPVTRYARVARARERPGIRVHAPGQDRGDGAITQPHCGTPYFPARSRAVRGRDEEKEARADGRTKGVGEIDWPDLSPRCFFSMLL